jgi:hypothetical protein
MPPQDTSDTDTTRYPLEGHHGHASHCLFCSTRYHLFGPAQKPPRGLTPEQEKEKFRKKFWSRLLFRGTLFLIGLCLATTALHYGGWTLVYAVRGTATVKVHDKDGQVKEEAVKWQPQDRILCFMLFLLVCSPMSICAGFVSAGIYYIRRHVKKEKAKKIVKAKEILDAMAEQTRLAEEALHKSSVRYSDTRSPDQVVPTITIDRAPPTHAIPAPSPSRAHGFRSSVARYLEDKTYKWNPNPGYVGTEQRRENFQGEVAGYEMDRLGAPGGVQAHRQLGGEGGNRLGVAVVDEADAGRVPGNRNRRNRDSTMTWFPTLR